MIDELIVVKKVKIIWFDHCKNSRRMFYVLTNFKSLSGQLVKF